MKNKLWTKDYTIITLGSAVSMFGNAMVGFAISLYVLDYTKSPYLYSLYVFFYTLPQIFAPLFAGPLMDRFSRRRTIYLLDATSASLYLILALLIIFGFFSFPLLATMTFVIGIINSAYLVAFNSFYPMLVSDGNYSKAYSVSSTLETVSYVMVPVATFLYKTFGILPVLIANSACFFTAAFFETRISDVEKARGEKASYSGKTYISDSLAGLRYLISEKGLLCISLFFFFSFFANGATTVLTLPWFKETYENGEYIYMSVWFFLGVGRILGGFFHYKWRIPAQAKFALSLFVYILSAALEGVYLFSPLMVMRGMCFLMGLCNSTAFNIRVSATQAYVPDDHRGRFNGAFLMMTTGGTLLGELTAGAVATVLPMRETLSIFMGVCILAALVFILGGRKHIKPIYNRKNG